MGTDLGLFVIDPHQEPDTPEDWVWTDWLFALVWLFAMAFGVYTWGKVLLSV